MKRQVSNFSEFISESKFQYEIKSEKYWRQIIGGDEYANKVLNTIMFKQSGFASDRQMAILRRIERGETAQYHPKN